VVYPVPTNNAKATESQWCICFIRNGGNAIPKHTCPEATGSNLPLDLLCSGLITHLGEILTTSKFHTKKYTDYFCCQIAKMTQALFLSFVVAVSLSSSSSSSHPHHYFKFRIDLNWCLQQLVLRQELKLMKMLICWDHVGRNYI